MVDETSTTAGEETTSTTGAGTTSTTGGTGETPPVSLEDPVNSHGTQALEGDSLPMELDDFYFEPTFVTAASGEAATVRLHNEGSVAHTFTIESLNVDEVVDAGQEREIRVDLPQEGLVRFICRFHVAQGMKGAFALE